MPRASWSGFLRLSLVSCPVYLSPATTRTKSLRLHQVWRPAAGDEPGPEEPDRDRDGQGAAGSRPQPADPRETERADQATRIQEATRVEICRVILNTPILADGAEYWLD